MANEQATLEFAQDLIRSADVVTEYDGGIRGATQHFVLHGGSLFRVAQWEDRGKVKKVDQIS